MTDAIGSGLQVLLGHGAPFSDEELARVRGPLLICGATSLSGIERCAGLEELTLFGCELGAVPDVARLPKLRVLKLLACDIADLSALAGCGALADLEVNFCTADDLRPILRVPALRRVMLYGGAWTPRERDEVVRAVESAPRAHGRGAIVGVDNPDAWRINQALRERGLSLRYSDFGLGVVLARPGRVDVGIGVEFVSTWPNLVDEGLADAALVRDAAAFMRQVAMPGIVQPETGPSRFIAQWETGDLEDARRWIAEAELDEGERALLSRFVGRFANQRFTRETPKGHERVERDQEVALPGWLKRQRVQAVATIGRAYRRMEMRFDGFDHDPLSLASRERWFSVGFFGYSDFALRELLRERCALYPVGFETDGRWRLAVPSDDEGDRRVFLYDERGLHDAGARARAESRRYAAFDSYAKMLSRVAAVRVDGEEVVALS